MRLSSWRIVKTEHARSAFSGEGARLYGGRWNSPGVSMVYTAGSRSLAALEMLVHLESADLLKSYVVLEAQFEDSLVRQLLPDELPAVWSAGMISSEVQQNGDVWSASGESPILAVPSAVIREETNFLINPRHAQFGEIEIGKPKPFAFDWRLGGR